MISQDQLKQLAQSDFGKMLIDYLDEKIKDLGNITKIRTFEELVGRQEAVKVLKELFNFLEKGREIKPEVKKNDYL